MVFSYLIQAYTFFFERVTALAILILQFYTEISTTIIEAYIAINRPILDAINSTSGLLFDILLIITIFVSLFFLCISVIALFSQPKKSIHRFNKQNVPFVTIQIPTYNEIAALNCAKKCLRMNYPKDKYEIIIGDDSNDPSISAKIDDFARKNNILVTRRGKNIGFKPGNLNHMLQFSKGEIIAIFDSDFLPEKNFLKKIVAPFQNDPTIGGVQARWEIYHPEKNKTSLLASAVILGFHHVYLPFMKKIGGVSFLCGSGEAVRKDLLIQNGGWLSGSLTEDIEYSLRLMKQGYRIEYLEDYGVVGEVPYQPKDLYKQQMRWAYGVTKSILMHTPEIYKNALLSYKEKFFIWFQGVGYVFSFLIFGLFVTGFISFVSNEPAPIDLALFFTDFTRNVLLSSGILVASFVGLVKTKLSKKILSALAASFTIGLIVVMYVNTGVFKAITGKRMHWFMLNKMGNKKKISV